MPTLSRRYGTIGGVKVRLAAWLPSDQRYSDRLSPVDPNLQFLPNERSTLVARQASAFWQMNEWRAGEGFDRWSPEREGGGYHQSDGVRPKKVGDGLILGPLPEITQDSTGASNFVDGLILGHAQGSLWTARSSNAHEWDEGNGRWGTAVATGATFPDLASSIADGQDTWIYAGYAVGTGGAGGFVIRRFKSGANAVWYATGGADDFAYRPVLASFGDRLFALDGDDLYEIDKSTADTRTRLVDVGGSSDVFLSWVPGPLNRLAVSDKGPIWYQRLDNGQTRIWEYNVAQDVGYIVGEIPVGMSFPTSIYYARGFIFVGFVATASSTSSPEGDGYIYFQRGAQRGVLGPIREGTSSLGGDVVLCGVVGDELIFFRDSEVWAYNLSAGGIYHLAGTGPATDGVVNGKDLFVKLVNANNVERFDLEAFTDQTATLDSGLYDMAYTDIPKRLTEITILTEPLPAGTSVSVSYTTDGTNYTALTGAHDVDGASEKTWIVSTSAGTTVKGRRFGIRLTLATTDTTVTPTVRGVLVRGTTAAHERQIIMQIDCSSDDTVGSQEGSTIVSGLKALVDAQDVVAFSNPFLGEPEDSPESIDVEVRNLIVPDVENPADRLVATVELVAVEMVT